MMVRNISILKICFKNIEKNLKITIIIFILVNSNISRECGDCSDTIESADMNRIRIPWIHTFCIDVGKNTVLKPVQK